MSSSLFYLPEINRNDFHKSIFIVFLKIRFFTVFHIIFNEIQTI